MAAILHRRTLPAYLEATAADRSSAIALIEGNRSVTYSDLRSRVCELAAHLRQQSVGRGDRVVLLVPNSIEFVAAFWAVQYVGAVAVPLNPDIKASKLQWIISDCSPSALVVDESLSSLLSQHHVADSSPMPVLVWLRRPGVFEAETTPGSDRCVCPTLIDQDLACILYTSGSTGTPKGVMLSHLNMVAASSSVAEYLTLASDDRVFCTIPFSFDYGLHQITMSALVGATLIVESSFSQPLFSLHRLARLGGTVFPIVPSMVSPMEPLASRFDLSRVRTITSTAAALHPGVIDRLQQLFRGARLFSMYGLTECHRCTYLDPHELSIRKSSVGKAIPNTELWVVDEDGRRHDRGATGELVIRGSTVMRGYWNNPAATAEKLRPGPVPGEIVLYTGDVCSIDPDGFVYFVRRKDDILKVKGHKVAPKEIEAALLEHPDVAEAAVVGIPHYNLGDEVIAFAALRVRSATDVAALRAWCAAHLEPVMVPRRIVLLDTLPKSLNGKIDRLALKEQCRSQEPLIRHRISDPGAGRLHQADESPPFEIDEMNQGEICSQT
jgi:amino acid adenylation domain-containing protein